MNPNPHNRTSEAPEDVRNLPVQFSLTATVGIAIQHRAEVLPAIIHDFDESTFFQIASRLDIAALSRIALRTDASSSQRISTKPTFASSKGKCTSSEKLSRKVTSFRFTAPDAGQVQLVGDFTDWEKHPVDLVRTNGGEWATVLPLKPGAYSYYFLVDGVRQKPASPAKRARGKGGRNCVMQVA